jgi:hypothetical protein
VLVDLRTGRLHDEHVGPADVLVDLERDLRVGKPLQPRMADLDLQELGNLLSQRAVGASREDLELLAAGRRQRACRNHTDTMDV